MEVSLRIVAKGDLPVFFQQQLDPKANYMAAFTSRDPSDWEAFMRHWTSILSDTKVKMKTVLADGQIAGHVASYIDNEFRKREVTYWIGKEYWGRGIATMALKKFLEEEDRTRPIYGRTAKDNTASLRVMEKCGFRIIGKDTGYAQARKKELEGLVLRLD